MNFATAFVAGLLFGAGLLLSGMTQPQTVLGFLDVAGDWNPALAFTMGGAMLVAAPAYWFVCRRGRTVTGAPVSLPSRRNVTVALLGGAAVFGVGWGLSGICPGPSLLLLTDGGPPAFAFFAAMIAGMFLSRLLRTPGRAGGPTGAPSPEEAT